MATNTDPTTNPDLPADTDDGADHGASSAPAMPGDAGPTGPLPDPRPGFSIALDSAAAVITQVTADDLERPTPCADFDVDHLVGHLIGAVRRIAAVGRGEHFATVDTAVSGIPAERLVDDFGEAAAQTRAAWADDARLAALVELPFGTMPGAAALGAYTSEITAHTWDLATAIGSDVDWDLAVVGTALAVMERALPPDTRGMDNGVPFGSVVPVAEDAPAIERFVAWVGRDPSWTAR